MFSRLPQLLLRNSTVYGRRLYSTVEKQVLPIIPGITLHSSNPMENYIIQQNLNTYEMLLKYSANLIAFPLAVAGFFEVQKNYQSVVMNFGKFHSIADEGLRWRTPLFTTRKRCCWTTDQNINSLYISCSRLANMYTDSISIFQKLSNIEIPVVKSSHNKPLDCPKLI